MISRRRDAGHNDEQLVDEAVNSGQGQEAEAKSPAGFSWWLRVLVVLALVAIGVFFITGFRLPPHLILDTGTGTAPIGPVTAHRTFIQPLSLDGRSRVTAVEIQLGTWGQATNDTHDRLTVYDDRGCVVGSISLPPGSVADNAYTRVSLAHAPQQARLYVALSSSDGSGKHSITAWSTTDLAQSPFFVLRGPPAGSPVAALAQARPRTGAICVRLYGLGPRALLAERGLATVGLAVCLVAAVIVAFYRPLSRSVLGQRLSSLMRAICASRGLRDRLTVPNVYLVVALLWGLVMVFVVPPFQVPDESAHFYRAWSVAELQLVARVGQKVSVPDDVYRLPARLGSDVVDWKTNHYSSTRARALLWAPLSSRQEELGTATASYGPIGYLPQAAGIEIARLLGHSALLGLYLARVFNLIVSVLIVFAALRLLPFGKPLMALVSLLPMTVAQMASVSPDGIVLSGAMLVTALVLNLSQRRLVAARDMIWLGLAATLLLNAKPGYALMAMLVFALVPRQFGGVPRWIVSVCAVLAAVFGVAAILFAAEPRGSSATLAGLGIPGVDQAAQLSLVLHNPLAFIQVLSATLNTNGLWLAQMTYGILGWLTVGLPIAGMLLAALAAIIFMGVNEPVTLGPWQRCVVAGTAAGLTLAISLALYMGWSAVGAAVISGIQGRYLIPVVVLGLFAVYGIRLTRRLTMVAVLMTVVVIMALTTIETLLRFYH